MGSPIDPVDRFRLEMITRLYDREIARKEMLEKNGYFLATILGILISSGLFQVKYIVEISQTLASQVVLGSYITALFAAVLCVVTCFFFLSLFHVMRLRGWYSGIPQEIFGALEVDDSSGESRTLIRTISSHMLGAHGIAFTNNNAKAFWLQCAVISLGTQMLTILAYAGVVFLTKW